MRAVDWVLHGSGESNKGCKFGSLQLELVCRSLLPLGHEKHVRLITLMKCMLIGGREEKERSRAVEGEAV